MNCIIMAAARLHTELATTKLKYAGGRACASLQLPLHGLP